MQFDQALRVRSDAFIEGDGFLTLDNEGKMAWELTRWCRPPGMSSQLRLAHCWSKLRARHKNQLGSVNHPPRHIILLLPVILVAVIHIVDTLLCVIAVFFPELLSSERLVDGTDVLMLLVAFAFQLAGLRRWLLACKTDPGFCSPAPRHGAQDPGPDGYERLVRAVQLELNELLHRQFALLDTASETDMGKEITSPDMSLEEIADAITDGKRRLAETLNQAGNVRQACYSVDYLQVCCSERAEREPGWWRQACVVCGRLRALRSKHCQDCGRCVARFDHHCPWLNNCVGVGNLAHFIFFLSWTLCALFLCEIYLSKILWAAVPVHIGWSLLWRLLLKVMVVLNFVFLVFMWFLLSRQIVLGAVDLTEYEASQHKFSFFGHLLSISAGTAVKNLNRVLSDSALDGWPPVEAHASRDVEFGQAHCSSPE